MSPFFFLIFSAMYTVSSLSVKSNIEKLLTAWGERYELKYFFAYTTTRDTRKQINPLVR